MASNTNSPIFTPPVSTMPERDGQIVNVGQKTDVDFGFRNSQKPNTKNDFSISHIPNGK